MCLCSLQNKIYCTVTLPWLKQAFVLTHPETLEALNACITHEGTCSAFDMGFNLQGIVAQTCRYDARQHMCTHAQLLIHDYT
jgi:hypothetical protein